jgi:hypothetical protein
VTNPARRRDANEIFTKFKPQQRPRGALLVAVLAHVVLAFVLASIVFHYPIRELLRIPDRSNEPPPERVQFVKVAPDPSVSGDTGRRATPPASAPEARGTSATSQPAAPLRAPTSVPTTLPPTSDGGSASGVRGGQGSGGGGMATGVTPSYGDPRVWVAPGPFVPLPRTTAQKVDSLVRDAFGVYAESVAVANANPQRAPGDWTVEKGGQKWGVDQRWVHLGKLKIPTAVLALLPLNVQGNPAEIERQRNQMQMRRDIMFQASRSVNEDEFRAAVKRIRERKERERREAAEKDRILP